jgi:hypothetical protein
MKPRCRYLTFSLRTEFILLTASAVWLGLVVKRAREQREAVKAIYATGGRIHYNWQVDFTPIAGVSGPRDVANGEPNGPAWLRKIIGDDFFQEIQAVSMSNHCNELDDNNRRLIPHLKRLRALRFIVWFRQACMNLFPRPAKIHRFRLRSWTGTTDATTCANARGRQPSGSPAEV